MNAHAFSPAGTEVDHTADDVQTRFSLHHRLIMLHGGVITQLLSGEDRQDAALTEIAAAIAELHALVDRLAAIERRLADMEARL